MNHLGWGILSTGHIAHKFAKHLPVGHLVAVASRDLIKAQAFVQKFGLPKPYGSYEALLEDNEVQAVYIATPHHLHKEWTLRAAAAGKHILCEKPLGMNLKEAEEMIEAVRAHNVFFMEAYMYRCHPQIARVLDLIRKNAIGDVRNIVASFSFRCEYNLSGRLLNPELGGGGILDVGGYCLSLVRLIAGARLGHVVEPIQMVAQGIIGEESRVDEYASALLTFPNQIFAQISCGVQLLQENVVRIEGTEGTLVLPCPWVANPDGGEAQIHLQKPGQPLETITANSPPLYALEAEVVARHVARGDREASWPAMTWADSLGNIRLQEQWLALLKG